MLESHIGTVCLFRRFVEDMAFRRTGMPTRSGQGFRTPMQASSLWCSVVPGDTKA
jgi:hypothetical protein